MRARKEGENQQTSDGRGSGDRLFRGWGPGRLCPASGARLRDPKERLTVLGSGVGMQINVYTQAIFAGPPEGFKDILPTGTSHERFVAPCLNRPEGNRETDPVQSCAGDLSEVLLSLWCVPLFEHLQY